MKKNGLFFMVVGGMLTILMTLYLVLGHLRHEREKDMVRNLGNDEQSRISRDEADEYRIANRNQQRGILAVGVVIVSMAVVWRIGQRRQESE